MCESRRIGHQGQTGSGQRFVRARASAASGLRVRAISDARDRQGLPAPSACVWPSSGQLEPRCRVLVARPRSRPAAALGRRQSSAHVILARAPGLPGVPAPIAPGCQWVALDPDVGCRVVAARAPWMTAADARGRKPPTAPRAVPVDGVERIFRACRQVSALHADQRLQRPAIDVNRRLQQQLEKGVQPVQRAVIVILAHHRARTRVPYIAARRSPPARRVSISAMARSMASNTSMVEAWRA